MAPQHHGCASTHKPTACSRIIAPCALVGPEPGSPLSLLQRLLRWGTHLTSSAAVVLCAGSLLLGHGLTAPGGASPLSARLSSAPPASASLPATPALATGSPAVHPAQLAARGDLGPAPPAAAPVGRLADANVPAPPSPSATLVRFGEDRFGEEKLMARVRLERGTGTPAGNLRACRLLQDHQARYAFGALAAERDATLQALRCADRGRSSMRPALP